MQDNARRSDPPATANARPEVISSGRRDDELYSLFQSLFEVTRTAGEHASAGDFAGIREPLQRRERLFGRIHELMPGKEQDVLALSKQLKSQLRAMLQSTQEENIRILQLIHERKKNVLGKIVEIQNRRHVFDYLR